MGNLNFLGNLTLSFQPRAYKRIAGQPFGRSFGFLLLFLLLISIIFTFKYTLFMRDGLKQANLWIDENLSEKTAGFFPQELKIENGEVSISEEEPFIRQWDFEESKEKLSIVGIVDTTGAITNLDDYPFGFLLTKHKLIFKNTKPREAAVEIKEYDLSQVNLFNLKRGEAGSDEIAVLTVEDKTIHLSKEILHRWLRNFGKILPLMLIPLLISSLITKTLFLLLFSLAALAINAATQSRLEYKNLLNIGIFALIPPTVAALLLELSGTGIPLFFLVYILIYVIFLTLGIVGSKIELPENEPAEK